MPNRVFCPQTLYVSPMGKRAPECDYVSRMGSHLSQLFVAIDRTSNFAFAQLYEKANRHTATAFLKALLAVVPYKIHAILTDNGIQFCDLPKNRSGPTARWQTHMFDLLCRAHGIEHRLKKPNHFGEPSIRRSE
jgi:transposase-like protein